MDVIEPSIVLGLLELGQQDSYLVVTRMAGLFTKDRIAVVQIEVVHKTTSPTELLELSCLFLCWIELELVRFETQLHCS